MIMSIDKFNMISIILASAIFSLGFIIPPILGEITSIIAHMIVGLMIGTNLRAAIECINEMGKK